MDEEQGVPPAGRTSPVLEQLRSGWHSLGGGDAAACPGCPVCRLTETAGRMDPVAAEHLHSAAGHLVQAGREVVAALGRLQRTGPAPRPDHGRNTGAGTDAGPDRGPARTRIPVATQDHQQQDHQQQDDEEQA